MNDQPRIETCSCSNVNTLFASFSARSHTKPHTKNQQQQQHWTILSTIEATSKQQQQQNIVRLRFHKSREPAVLSSASGVFFLFFIRFSFIVCAHLCSSHIERIAVAVVVVTYCLFVCYCSDAAAAVFCLVSALFSDGFVLDAVLSPPRVVCNKFNAHIHSLTLTDACENTRKRTRDI